MVSVIPSQLLEGPQDLRASVSITVVGRLGYLRFRCVGPVACGASGCLVPFPRAWSNAVCWVSRCWRVTDGFDARPLGAGGTHQSHPRFFFDISLSFSLLLVAWEPVACWHHPSCCFAAVECSWLFPASDNLRSRALRPHWDSQIPGFGRKGEWGSQGPRHRAGIVEALSNCILGRRTY